MKKSAHTYENSIKGEIFSIERLEEYAAFLATELSLSDDPKITQPLLPRMRDNGSKLLETYRTLTESVHRKETLPPAGEWLIDNFHIIEDQIREIKEDLPPKFYKELPKVAVGELKGYPRIYAIALALVAHTDSQLEASTIRRFIEAFQKKAPLRIGELWALAITLRLVLVENLRRIAIRVVTDHEKRNSANRLADQLFEVVSDKKRFQALLPKLSDHFSTHCFGPDQMDCAFMAQMAKRLRDQEPELFPALESLEKYLAKVKSSTEEVVNLSHQLQASHQVTVANIITSMRLLSSLNWRIFFESMSLVDRVLEKDPVYTQMDFQTRDAYRHVIEKISKRTHASEIKIAEKALEYSLEHSTQADSRLTHVGYYIIGKGLKKLEKNFGYRAPSRIYPGLISKPYFLYFGLMSLSLFLVCFIPIFYAAIHEASFFALFGIFIVILIPGSDLAISIVNSILTKIIPPKNLPKLDLTKGIPPLGKTMVVIPCVLSEIKVIEDLIEKIEIHYLGNADEQVYFSLLSDFVDSANEILPEDAAKLKKVKEGIAYLNQKYASGQEERFFVFHRARRWNPSEKLWMGWERKRGKIHEFNRVLRGDQGTSFSLITAPQKLLVQIQFVLTLDADTQLPRDSAKKLIGTLLHPLNRPHFDQALGRVTEGYGVLQPRIGITLESCNQTLFSKIFSGHTGIDPYTTAVSDVYQDLFQEGSYTGKGLYDVDAFEMALAQRVPENTILSHDLFEGLFARVGLLTDVELLDDYPRSYHAFFTRQHRWIRGDWQIAAWIFPWVRAQSRARVKNQLSLISKWKIFDNLRRSLVAPSVFLLFILSAFVFPGLPQFWIIVSFFFLIAPSLVHAFFGIVRASITGKNTKNKFLQILLYFIFLAHQAYVHLDAIARVMFRMWISKKKMLEWTPAAQVENQNLKINKPYWQRSNLTQFFLGGLAIIFYFSHPHFAFEIKFILIASLGFWMSYPFVAKILSQKLSSNLSPVSLEDQLLLRQIARRTWHYFETFVGSEDHGLPPDNHQESPTAVTAHRTSPTNIGLYILSLVSARDFGFMSSSEFMTLLGITLESMRKLEKYEGHFLNWYDTLNLQPLNPKYVSTVDSGNLAGYLLVGKEVCLEIPNQLAIDPNLIDGLKDTLSIIESEIESIRLLGNPKASADLLKIFLNCRKTLVTPPSNTFTAWVIELRRIAQAFEQAKTNVLALKADYKNADFVSLLNWLDAINQKVKKSLSEVSIIAPWTSDSLNPVSNDQNTSWLLLFKFYDSAIEAALKSKRELNGRTQFVNALQTAKSYVANILDQAKSAALYLDQTFVEMNFSFLLDQEREVFVIGYSVSDSSFDKGLYDLLGSESRLASFIAIAKGDAPQEHWFRLGRQLVPSENGRALVSWTASMFEYLMPILVLRNYENTLLHETMNAVVSRQIAYGLENQVPWGISEAGYNARDLQLNYQYGPFGIPGFGLKRGLSHDLVISPYSTALALMVNPKASIQNLKTLMSKNLLTDYGFYESVDYTRERLPVNQKFAIIKSFMAHHQGMSLVSINNLIHHQIIQNRFHADRRVQATRLLLQERVPTGVISVPPKAAEIELAGRAQFTESPLVRTYIDPNKANPHIQLLSNRHYSLMISTAGGGYSKCGGLAVTRWKEDATRDHSGSYIFVRNCTQKNLWSTTYQPLCEMPDEYEVTFGEEKVEFRRKDQEISTYTQIIVAPEDPVEIRLLTLSNHSDEDQILELTSYLEPVLNFASNDSDHPAFSKLFIQTEFLPSKNALLAKRRKRSEHDKENWGLHVVVTDAEIISDIQYETDRVKFIGRGRSLSSSIAMNEGQNLSNTSGATLDPILSLRIKVKVPANGKIQVAFTTGMVGTYEEALGLADRYHDVHAFEREYKLAWTKSQADLRHLNIDSEAAYLYQRVAERILYSEPSLRPPSHQRAANTNMQSSLWPSGISGDLPIVVVRIKDKRDIAVVRKLLRCHEYLRLKGLVYDFIILNEDETTYLQGLQDELLQQIRTTGCQEWLNKKGGVFILRSDITPEKDIEHIRSIARVSLAADEPFKDQITRNTIEEKYPPLLMVDQKVKIEKPGPLKRENLDFWNGIGGFSQNGREYTIILNAGQWSPAPWINVIGNSRDFGFQVSESGSGFTWSANSQSNRLTPWSNDPVLDTPGEIIYLRDDETGEIWTPTPLPIRSDEPYTIKHGQGYSIFQHTQSEIVQTLTLFVPKDDTLKISLLKLKNLSNRKRKISITSYTEWVLGTQREKTAAFLVCDLDQGSGAIFARNPHDNEFAEKVAFADINTVERTFTCSRKEFLGRNGNYVSPAALKREGLSRKRGTGQDPCAVLQTSIELEVGEEREVSFLLGQCENSSLARALTLRYRDLSVVKGALKDVTEDWKKRIDVIQIKTPEPAMDRLMNHWLLYQTLSCRYWSRTAFYQSGGAYGFRDQLQDCMAFIYSDPQITKEHILRASAHQFKEGDVQHWWHPPTGRGVRTRMTDDLLWLPYVVSFYINITGDRSILDEVTPFLEAPLLKPEEEDSYTLPQVSSQSETLFEHCLRAINYSLTLGQNGLPLIGTGDWNDGMNRVGAKGQGESVWLAWFFAKVLTDFLPFCDQPEQKENREKFEAHILKLKLAIEKNAWDGEWYKRATFDDGTPLGSSANEECKIDSIAQSWAVLSGAGDLKRSAQAMAKVSEYLVRKDSKIVLLFTPPFDQCARDPGYIKGYVPGVRENGGQYTHAAVWVVMAYAKLGDGNRALEIFNMLNPILHSQSEKSSKLYKIEPYVMAGDVYSGNSFEGRGGWSWYTGSASWYYRAGLESILGFNLKGNTLKIEPCIPNSWEGYEISYGYGKSKYLIQVKNPNRVSSGKVSIILDGVKLPSEEILLIDDGSSHVALVTLVSQ